MDAIILAAGKGTRLRPYTEKVPKPLLPVQGRPILDWIIGALPPVDRLIVVVNYLGEAIEEYLAKLGTTPIPRGDFSGRAGARLEGVAEVAQSLLVAAGG